MTGWMEFHFLRPWWFLALLPWSWLVWRLFQRVWYNQHWLAVCDRALLPHMLTNPQQSWRRSYYSFIAICGVIVIVALAGPVWERMPQSVYRGSPPLVIALDLSASMNAADIKPSRLQLARYKIADLLRTRGDGQTGMVVYAGDAFVVSPLTDDVATISAQLPALESDLLPQSGSNSVAALTQAAALLQQAGQSEGHILLVTDEMKGDAVERKLQALVAQRYPVSVLAVGSEAGAPIRKKENGPLIKDADGTIVLATTDHTQLRYMASVGGGRYTPLRADNADIAALEAFFSAGTISEIQEEENLSSQQWREFGPWLLWLVIPFALPVFRRGGALLGLFLLLPVYSESALAISWEEFLRNADQQGKYLLDQGQAEQAAEVFQDLQWQSVAHYQAEDYMQVIELLEESEDITDQYNLGNAFAQLGRYSEAIAAYDRVLQQQPTHEDAEYNRELVKQLLQNSSAQSQSGESGEAGEPAEGSAGTQGAGGESSQDEELASKQDQTASQDSAEDSSDNSASEQQNGSQSTATAMQESIEEMMSPDQPQDSSSSAAAETIEQQENPALASAEEAQKGAGEDGDEMTQQPSAMSLEQEQIELSSVTEQWLRRIPDDPGGLLRRKFLYQYQQRAREQPLRKGQQQW